MLDGRQQQPRPLRLPPGGVEAPATLAVIRNMTAELHKRGCSASWMVVAGEEVVGLCSYRRPPKNGEVEIGYGIAPSRRQAGYATRAVAALLEYARRDCSVSVVIAETAVLNIASQRVLEKNGFERAGTRTDPEDGEVVIWRKELGQSSTELASSST